MTKTMVLGVILLIALSSVGIGALVNYLSNKSTVEVTIETPVLIKVLDDDDVTMGTLEWIVNESYVPNDSNPWTDDILLDSGFGGSIRTFWTKVLNQADVTEESNLVYKITCSEGFTVDNDSVLDFDAIYVTIYDWNNTAYPIEERVISFDDTEFGMYGIETDIVGDDYLIWYPSSYLYENGEDGDTYYVEITLEFAGTALGTYNIDVAWLDDPYGSWP